MLKQFNRFILLALIVAGALYITLTNSDSATLRLGPTLTITTYAGVIYIAIFVVGCVAASLVALFFGLKGYLRERKLASIERGRQTFLKVQRNARALMAAHDWRAARKLWEDVISQDPDNQVARVELSRCIEELGDLRESLRVLDSSRATSHVNMEVLFRAALLNQRLGNNTAARDNLSIILSHNSSRRALELARDTSEALGQFAEAISFQQDLERNGYESECSAEIIARLLYKQIMSGSANQDIKQRDLAALTKRHPNFVPALESLAEIARSQGNLEACAENLVKAARAARNDIAKWRCVVHLWLRSAHVEQRQRYDRAIAAARSASKDSSGRVRLEAELLLIETLLAANHFQDAERLIDGFAALVQREAQKEPTITFDDLTRCLVIQRGYCLAQTGNVHATGTLWQQLAAPEQSNNATETGEMRLVANRVEPSPILSTP